MRKKSDMKNRESVRIEDKESVMKEWGEREWRERK